MQSKASTVAEYLAELPADRRIALQAIRTTILANLPAGYEEGMQYGMIGYFVPHSVYPPGYHCDPRQPLPFVGLASQKHYMALYLFCIYSDPTLEVWFREAWIKTGKKLDMGKSCIRFRKFDDVPLKVIGQTIRRVPTSKHIKHYESVVKPMTGKRARKNNLQKTAAAKRNSVRAIKKSTSRS
ncbi:MAG: DUF1801 domain-containing protein [Pirellulales bacterium]